MAIVAGDIKLYLSGGGANSDPNAALGGAISSTEVTDNTLHNLFDKVTGAEGLAGDTEYRCIYVKNTHGSLTLESAKVWVQTNTPSGDSAIAIALGGEGENGTAETIADESTAPSGESFSAPVDYANGLSLGDLDAGNSYPIWVRRTITASAAAYDDDSVVLGIQGDTAA